MRRGTGMALILAGNTFLLEDGVRWRSAQMHSTMVPSHPWQHVLLSLLLPWIAFIGHHGLSR